MNKIKGVTILNTIIFSKEIDGKSKIVETQYEIEVDDTASFNEVYNKYIILERRDEHVFLVIERYPSGKVCF